MELNRKNAVTQVTGQGGLTVSMKWTTAADFDLAVLYEDRSGKIGLIYFGELGRLDAYPFMELSEDQGSQDAKGDYQETVRIDRPDEMAALWFLYWDYAKVQSGLPCDDIKGDVRLEVKWDGAPDCWEVKPDLDESGNVLVLASLSDLSSKGGILRNHGAVGTIHGLTRVEDLMAIVRG